MPASYVKEQLTGHSKIMQHINYFVLPVNIFLIALISQ